MNALILRKNLVLRRISELFGVEFNFFPLARKLYPHFEMDKNQAFHRWLHNLISFIFLLVIHLKQSFCTILKENSFFYALFESQVVRNLLEIKVAPNEMVSTCGKTPYLICDK